MDIQVSGGVHGALRGPLPIGPKLELDEDDGVEESEVAAIDTCKFPR